MPNTKPQVSTIHQNNVRIIGDNVLYNNGIITAFYVVPLVNYSTSSDSGVEGSVQSLVDMVNNLWVNNQKVAFTIEKIEKVVKAKDVKNNLLGTIHIYEPDLDMPIEFSSNVRDAGQSYCLLGIDIQQTTLTDVEEFTIWDTIKHLFGQTVNTFIGLGNVKCDPEQILKIEEATFRTIRGRVMRASKELVFYNYVSKVFPNFEISYDKLSYINENTFEDIMGSVTQTISDNFGWFEMHNEGVDIFGIEPQTTYGCMLDVQSFPPMIATCNFPFDYANCVTSIKCREKEEAILALKRVRSSRRFERDQAIEAGAENEQIGVVQDIINIATEAVDGLENRGAILCEFNTSILIYDTDKERLKQKVTSFITGCKDRKILVTKSLTQAKDFLDNYINKKPKKYIHMANIDFPLAFQQNAGATVGDDGTDVSHGNILWSPSIGTDEI